MSANAHPMLKPLPAAICRHYGWTALALLPGVALAGPTGEQVQQGTVAITRPDANTTTVTQGSNSAVVNWHSFSVDGQEYVQFVQPGANAAILNRVTGGNASQILGRIDANGRVFLVNPQGVYFGAGSRVETAGFAASTLDITDDDFMQGRYVFSKGTGAPDATVSNSGEITADQFVVLMGDKVANEGLVQARLGTVALAAGEQVTMQLDTSGLVSFAVDEATAAAHAGVENTGEIVANGGRVLMTAKVANDLVATAVNNAGVVRAVGVTEEGGQIFLRGSGGAVVNSGTLDASGATGGRVIVQSTTDDVEITAGAVVKATGTGSGDGGTVRLVANQTLKVEADALVDARGGAAGTGGLIEVSAHEGVLHLDGEIRAGEGGEVIVDPARLGIGPGGAAPGGNSTLATVGKGFIESQLNANTDVTLVAGDEIFASGGPFTITATGTGDLSLRIGNMVSTGSGAFDGGGSYGGDCGSLGICSDVGVPNGSFNFAPDTSGDINLTGININIAGVFTASAGSATGNVNLGAVSAAQVGINQQNTALATGNVVTGALTATNGNVLIDAGATTGNVTTGNVSGRTIIVNQNGALLATGAVAMGNLSAQDTIRIDAGTAAGNLSVGGITMLTGSHSAQLDLEAAAGNVNIGGNVSVTTTPAAADVQVDIVGQVVNVNGNVIANAGASGTGSIDITAVSGININGNVTVTGGGDSASVDMFVSGTGNININGNVNALGGFAASTGSIFLEANNGNINVSGNLLATGEDSANIFIEGNRIVIGGGLTAVANGSYGSASIELFGRTGIDVTGAITGIAESDVDIDISNSAYGGGSGDIFLRGAVLATAAFNDARIDIDNDNGSVRLGGVVLARQTGGTSSENTAEVEVDASQNIIVTGAVGASADIAFSSVDLDAVGLLQIDGPVGARSLQSSAFVRLEGSSVLIRNVVVAEAQDDAFIRAEATNGAIATADAGLLRAENVQLGISDATLVAVRTDASNIGFSHYGSGSPDIALDNTAHTGPTTIFTSTFIGGSYGSYGSSFRGFNPNPTPSVFGGVGAVKAVFNGDVTVIGDFAARNAIIEVTGGSLTFGDNVLIGERNLPASEGDALSLLALSRGVRPDGTRIPLPRFNGVVTAGPNAVFRAQTGITFKQGLGFHDPDTPYVVFRTDGTLDLGPGVFSDSSIGNEFLAQFTPFTPTNTIHVEEFSPLVPFADGPTFSNAEHFKKLPGTTMILGGLGLPGGPQRGSVVIGENGPIDIGAQNILFSSRGTIRGVKNVLSTGFIGEVGSAQDALARVFQTVNNTDVKDDPNNRDKNKKTNVDIESGDGEGGDELVAQKSNNGQMCE